MGRDDMTTTTRTPGKALILKAAARARRARLAPRMWAGTTGAGKSAYLPMLRSLIETTGVTWSIDVTEDPDSFPRIVTKYRPARIERERHTAGCTPDRHTFGCRPGPNPTFLDSADIAYLRASFDEEGDQ